MCILHSPLGRSYLNSNDLIPFLRLMIKISNSTVNEIWKTLNNYVIYAMLLRWYDIEALTNIGCSIFQLQDKTPLLANNCVACMLIGNADVNISWTRLLFYWIQGLYSHDCAYLFIRGKKGSTNNYFHRFLHECKSFILLKINKRAKDNHLRV